ncbi:MAG: DUF2851 family protein [Schleiferiaceae bacterium]|nr:DUF2851 family protein [Schleiferiaceae bacterium]
MTEDFLHYIWRTRQVVPNSLKTVNGDVIRVLHQGQYNENAGPDFLEAMIEMEGKMWAGQIEMHIRSSDWDKHNHSRDDAYDNVILHVVYEHDKTVLRKDGSIIQTLELKGKIDEHLYWRYEQLLQGERFIPCENQLHLISVFEKTQQYDKWIVERLFLKSKWMLEAYKTEGNWDSVFYQSLMHAFGLKVNAEPFLQLSRKLPLKILEKHSNSHFQLEALLFGASGLLENDFEDEYPLLLKKEFSFLQQKYDLVTLEKVEWKFSRMRPQGFPTIRLAQLSAILFHQFPNFDEVISQGNLDGLYTLLGQTPGEYWKPRFTFDKISSESDKRIGVDFMNRVIINSVVPLMFVYAEIKKEPFYKQRALDILDQLPAEKNKITNTLRALGFKNDNGFESQALLQMYSSYCRDKKCLNCSIANKLIKL